MTICAVLQPSYLPWIGYLEQVVLSDVFVLLDDVPFDKNGWRNRNRILLGGKPSWLTVPVLTRGRMGQLIREVSVDSNQPWLRRHRLSLQHAYSACMGWTSVANVMADPLLDSANFLVDINRMVLARICDALDIRTPFICSSQLEKRDCRTERLIDICREVGATSYLSGQAAKAYLDTDKMIAAGIKVLWHRHTVVPYPQNAAAFEPNLSVVDLIANIGPDAAAEFIRSRALHE